MAQFGAGPTDYTCACFAALLNWVEDGLVWKAMVRMQDQIDADLVERWTSLQTAMIERIDRDTEAGLITGDQEKMALDLLTNLDRFDWTEAVEQFMVWVTWVRGEEV